MTYDELLGRLDFLMRSSYEDNKEKMKESFEKIAEYFAKLEYDNQTLNSLNSNLRKLHERILKHDSDILNLSKQLITELSYKIDEILDISKKGEDK